MEDSTKIIETNENPEVNMGAHDPQVDLARNKNLFKKSLYVAGAFVLILIAICTLQYCSSNNAKKEISKADIAYEQAQMTGDSAKMATAINMYKEIAKGNSDAAQRAKVISAEDEYKKGNYQAALDYMKGMSTKSPIMETMKYCLMGDCYINMDDADSAIASFNTALEEANDNPELTPYILSKLANVYRFKGMYAQELETLKKLYYGYPDYRETIHSDIARAEAQAK